jgi:general secretion pathway protein A
MRFLFDTAEPAAAPGDGECHRDGFRTVAGGPDSVSREAEVMTDNTSTDSGLPDPHGYLSYYGLRAEPFPANADQKFLWLGRTHRVVLAMLMAAIRQSDGIFLLTGDVGAGKTSLASGLIDGLSDEGFVIGRVPNPGSESSDFYQTVANAYAIRGTCQSKAAFVPHFLQLLRSAGASQKKVLLIIDDAHNLSHELLRAIGDFSTIATALGHALAIVLVGQNDLNTTLSEEQHTDLRRRITARCAVDSLTPDEVGEYIRHCLKIAGAEDGVFSDDAIPVIASISQGAPGLINTICKDALLTGFGRQARVIDREIIEDSFARLELPGGSSERGAPHPERFGAEPGSGRARTGGRWGDEVEAETRLARFRSAKTPYVVLLAALILIAGGYFLYAGSFIRIRHDSTREVSPAPVGRSRDQQGSADRKGPSEVPVSPPRSDVMEPVSVPAVSPSAPTALPSVKDASPKDVRRRESAGPVKTESAPTARTEDGKQRRAASGPRAAENQRSDMGADSPDGADIVDWLLKERVPEGR